MCFLVIIVIFIVHVVLKWIVFLCFPRDIWLMRSENAASPRSVPAKKRKCFSEICDRLLRVWQFEAVGRHHIIPFRAIMHWNSYVRFLVSVNWDRKKNLHRHLANITCFLFHLPIRQIIPRPSKICTVNIFSQILNKSPMLDVLQSNDALSLRFRWWSAIFVIYVKR